MFNSFLLPTYYGKHLVVLQFLELFDFIPEHNFITRVIFYETEQHNKLHSIPKTKICSTLKLYRKEVAR